MHRNHDTAKAQAFHALKNGLPFATGRKNPETAKGWNSSYPEHGIYRDAVLIHDGLATWAYHGTPIVQRNLTTGEIKFSTQGWDTKTTIDRLRYAGAHLYRHKGKSYKVCPWGKGAKELREHPEYLWADDTLTLPQDTYCKIDGWRGYFAPLTAVVGASNTGEWSDSPCKPEDELSRVRSFLSAHGVKSTICWTETSNVFCTKNWVQVHPKYRDKAIELVSEFILTENTELLHTPA